MFILFSENMSVQGKLSILNGILRVTSPLELYTSSCHGLKILELVLALAFQSNDGITALSASRVINQWTIKTKLATSKMINSSTESLSPTSPLMQNLVKYFWLSWQHYLDSVKNVTKESFMNYVCIQRDYNPNTQGYFFQLVKELMEKENKTK